MLLSYTIVDFHLFYDGAVDIHIWALLTRSQCKVSDTQVTVKACGPLVIHEKKIIHHAVSNKRIFSFRPNDSRMAMALGESYEKLERLQEAKKCFWKAHVVGDMEGMALIKLAK